MASRLSITNDFLELPKLMQYTKEDPLSQWLYFIKHEGSEEESMTILLKDNPAFQSLDKEYHNFTRNDTLKERYEARQKHLHDTNSRLEEGREEGIHETALRLKKEGVSTEVIIRATGLSLEEVERL